MHWRFPKVGDIFYILFGSALIGLSLAVFLVPLKISNGGVPGLAMILHHTLRLPTGLIMFVINIPVFLIGIRFLGKLFGIRTIIAVVLSSFFTDFFAEILKLQPLTNEPFLGAIFGGIVMGAGLGLVYRAGGSTGGSDIVGQLAAKFIKISPGQAILTTDVLVIAAAGIAFKSVELAMWGLVSLVVSSYALDIVLQGLPYARVVYIISDKADVIGKRVNLEMGRGATIIPAWGVYTGDPRKVIFVVLTRKELPRLKQIVKETDKEAFTFVSEVFTVIGKGFRDHGTTFPE